MNGRTIKNMASGRMVDLAGLKVSDIDFFGDVAPALARLCRFDGAMRCAPYSVAQHCVLMADAALDETGDANVAAACLLHDAHEAYLGDLTKPVQGYLETFFLPTAFREAIEAAKRELDRPIFRAAGIPSIEGSVVRRMNEPGGRNLCDVIAEFDLRMLVTEIRHLTNEDPADFGVDAAVRPIRMRGAIRPWPVARAEMEWLERLATFCPNHQTIAASSRRES